VCTDGLTDCEQGGREGWCGARMTSNANGSMILDFIANMSRSN
jgi:hypothetical protein